MKRLPRTVLSILASVLAPLGVLAQTPAAPTIDAVHGGDGGLTVAWTAPSGVTGVTAYDVRFIRTSGDETVDANWTVKHDAWTSGGLHYVLNGLSNGVGYDVQVRAVTTVDGAWSATSAGTPADPGSTRTTAATLPLDLPLRGFFQSGTEVDYFKFTLASRVGVAVYARSDVNTDGRLLSADGSLIASNDHGGIKPARFSFLIWQTLDAGTYYVEVTSGYRLSGSYAIRVKTMRDSSGMADAEAVQVGGAEHVDLEFGPNTGAYYVVDVGASANGLIDPAGDEDWFSFTLTKETDVVLRSGRPLRDTVGELLDGNGTSIVQNDDGFLLGQSRTFLIRRKLQAGKYFVKVRAWSATATGLYSFHVDPLEEPGSTIADAARLGFGELTGGRIDPSSDADYFRIDLSRAGHVFGRAVSNAVDIDGELLDSGGTAKQANLFEQRFRQGPLGFSFSERLSAGTHYLKVTRSGGSATGGYAIQVIEDDDLNKLVDKCSRLPRPFTDPLYGCQWNLRNRGQLRGTAGEDIRVEDVWSGGNMGAGIGVAVVDWGLHEGHPDLAANVDTSRGHDYSPNGDGLLHIFNGHGTRVAGVVAMRDNDIGGRGVAPRATVYGYNYLRNQTNANRADAMTRNMDTTGVSVNSWGPADGPGLDQVGTSWTMAVDLGVSNGYGGKGVFYVWAAGNGRNNGDDANFDEYTTHHGVTAACATNNRGKRYSLSEQGANLWICAPASGILTTDPYGRYRDWFDATSAAAPTVGGVAALVRAANAKLTWRDVKLILAASARKNDAANTGWLTGASKYGDSGRYEFNHEYGFGVVDAKAAVDLAAGWTNLPAFIETAPASASPDLRIPDATGNTPGSTVTSAIDIGGSVDFVEYVEVNVVFDAPAFRDLKMELVSPSNTISTLAVPYRDSDPNATRYGLRTGHRFGSARHLGENPAGTWTLRLADHVAGGAVSTLKSWNLVFRGHRAPPNRSPLAVGTLAAQTLRVGEAAVKVEVSGGFRDPDGDALTYGAVSSAPGVASVSVSGSAVRVSPVSGGTATVTATATDVSGSNTSVEQQFAVRIRNRREVAVDPVSLTVTEGGSGTYSVALKAEPSASVTVTASVPAGTDVTVSPPSLTFGTTGWGTAQPVTVSAAEDTDALSDSRVVIRHGVSGGDYGSVTAPSVTVTIVENDASAVSTADVSVSEGAGDAVFEVALSVAGTSDVLVDYATSDVSASAGSDYTAVSGTLTFSQGSTASREIRVPIVDDALDESEEETFALTLRNVRNGLLAGGGSSLRVVGTIQDDDDPQVTASFGASRYAVREGGTATVEVRLNRDPERFVEIFLERTERGGATSADYSAPSSVSFGSGETRRTFEVAVVDDAEDDTGESVVLRFAAPLPDRVTASGGTTIAILDDDGRQRFPPPPPPPPPPPGGGGPPPPPPPPGGGGPPPPPPPPQPPPPPAPPPSPPPVGPPRAAIETDAGCEAAPCRVRTGMAVSFRDASTGAVRSRLWDFGDGGQSRSAGPSRAWSSPGFYEVTLTVSDGDVESTAALTFLVEAAELAGSCVADDETRCLGDSRFAVKVDWHGAGGEESSATVAHAGTNDSGMFWFFDRANWEVLVKVLDGCGVNGRVWVFAASTTDLGYAIRVEDTTTGEVREYRAEPGAPAAAITDMKAFPNACAGD